MWIPGDLNCLFAPNICSVGVVIGDSGAVSKGQKGCDVIQETGSAAGKLLLLPVLHSLVLAAPCSAVISAQ